MHICLVLCHFPQGCSHSVWQWYMCKRYLWIPLTHVSTDVIWPLALHLVSGIFLVHSALCLHTRCWQIEMKLPLTELYCCGLLGEGEMFDSSFLCCSLFRWTMLTLSAVFHTVSTHLQREHKDHNKCHCCWHICSHSLRLFHLCPS